MHQWVLEFWHVHSFRINASTSSLTIDWMILAGYQLKGKVESFLSLLNPIFAILASLVK